MMGWQMTSVCKYFVFHGDRIDSSTNYFHLQNFLSKNMVMFSLVHFLCEDPQFSSLHCNGPEKHSL